MIERVVFLTTDRCPIRCRFCGPGCGPQNRDTLDAQWIADRINDVERWGCLRQVIFSGGEPFLLGDALVDLVALCTEKHLLTRIVTNAYWARTPKHAIAMLRKFKDAGLSEINFSVDDFHQEHIPLSRIKAGIDACVSLDIPLLLAHKRMRHSVLTIEELERRLGMPLPVFDERKPNRHPVMISSGWTVPIGRGSDKVTPDDWTPDGPGRLWHKACNSIMKEIIISPRKELQICCGIIAPDIPDVTFPFEDGMLVETLKRANGDLLTNWLRLEGPYGIMRFIKQKRPEMQFHDRYVNNCHLCNDVLGRAELRQLLDECMDEYLPVIQAKRMAYEYCRTYRGLSEETNVSQRKRPARRIQ